ncbi:MAG: hypothetical protein QXF90_08020 [Thermofilaceae archaeon]
MLVLTAIEEAGGIDYVEYLGGVDQKRPGRRGLSLIRVRFSQLCLKMWLRNSRCRALSERSAEAAEGAGEVRLAAKAIIEAGWGSAAPRYR